MILNSNNYYCYRNWNSVVSTNHRKLCHLCTRRPQCVLINQNDNGAVYNATGNHISYSPEMDYNCKQ